MAAFPLPDGSVVVTPGGPNNDLPVGPPGIWPSPGHPAHPIYLPKPPPSVWPPPVSIWPPTPLPPDYPMPPGSIWPPVIDNTLPGAPPRPDNTLPGSPPRPGQGLPSQKFLVAIVAVSASGGLEVVGYTVVDPSLSVGYPLPLPPTAQPK
jgi:hypothetical protein